MRPPGFIIVVIGTSGSPFKILLDRFELVSKERSSCQGSDAGKRGDWDRLTSPEKEGRVSG